MSKLDSFILASDRVVEFQAYFDSIPTDNHSLLTLDVQKDEIVLLWSRFRECYDMILHTFDKLEEEIDIETIKSRFYSTFEAHVKVLSKSNELLDSLCRKPGSNTVVDDVLPPSRETPLGLSLHPCDTEVFVGDYQSWPTFRDMFTALYRNNKRLSPVENMCHLIKKTQGEARDLLRTCPVTNDGFEMAWNNLVARYENKRILINTQLKALFNISAVLKETGSSIRQIQRTINDCVTNLTLPHINADNWDQIFVYICSTCLPEATLSLWEQSLPRGTELPTWKQMNDFITSRFQTLESIADIRITFSNPPLHSNDKLVTSKKSNPFDKKNIRSYSTKVSGEKNIICSLCPNAHPLRLCPSFLRISNEERFSVVERQNRCTNCLGTHVLKRCKSQFVCHMCKQKHHSLLHKNSTASNVIQPFHSQSVPVPDAPYPVVNTQDTSLSIPLENLNVNLKPSTLAHAAARTQQSYSTQLQSTSNSTVLLGTALVDIYSNDLKYTVRALIDSASEATFISAKLQHRLSLKPRYLQTEVHGLNDALTATSNQVYHIQIGSPIDKSFHTQTDAFVVKKLTGKLPHYPLSTRKEGAFANLYLADNPLLQNPEVDILLGGDVYPAIIKDGARWDQHQSLVAQETAFGWIITGKLRSPTSARIVSSFHNQVGLKSTDTKILGTRGGIKDCSSLRR